LFVDEVFVFFFHSLIHFFTDGVAVFFLLGDPVHSHGSFAFFCRQSNRRFFLCCSSANSKLKPVVDPIDVFFSSMSGTHSAGLSLILRQLAAILDIDTFHPLELTSLTSIGTKPIPSIDHHRFFHLPSPHSRSSLLRHDADPLTTNPPWSPDNF